MFDFVLNNIGENNNMMVLLNSLCQYIFLNVTVIMIAIMYVIMITLIFILVITPLCSTPQHLVVGYNVII